MVTSVRQPGSIAGRTSHRPPPYYPVDPLLIKRYAERRFNPFLVKCPRCWFFPSVNLLRPAEPSSLRVSTRISWSLANHTQFLSVALILGLKHGSDSSLILHLLQMSGSMLHVFWKSRFILILYLMLLYYKFAGPCGLNKAHLSIPCGRWMW